MFLTPLPLWKTDTATTQEEEATHEDSELVLLRNITPEHSKTGESFATRMTRTAKGRSQN